MPNTYSETGEEIPNSHTSVNYFEAMLDFGVK